MGAKKRIKALKNKWEQFKANNTSYNNLFDLDPLFNELKKPSSRSSELAKQELLKDRYLLEQLEWILKNLLRNPNTVNNKLLLKEAAALIKRLDINNPRSKRSKKYLRLGIAATLFGVVWIAGLIFGWIFLGPLWQFAVVSANIATATVFEVYFVRAIFSGFMRTIVGHLKSENNTSINGVDNQARGVRSSDSFGTESILMALGVYALPLAPFIAAAFLLKRAHSLSKAPTGLALALAHSFPALAEKAHYGNKYETAHEKLKKAQEKLSAFNKIPDSTLKYTNKKNRAYIQAGVNYYQNRVDYLKAKADNNKTANPENNSKDILMIAKESASDKYKNLVSVRDHRADVVGRIPRLSESLSNTLFANHYDVKHAMKVEEAAREVRRQEALARA